MKKFFMFVGMIITTTFNAIATDAVLYSCPAGCFCINNGKYDATYGINEYLCTTPAQHMPSYCENGRSFWTYRTGLLACPGITSQQANYYMDDFAEIYKGYYGFYGFIGNDLILMPSNENVQGRYQCPITHPSSDKGAKTIFECYKIAANGQKEYYTIQANTQNNYSGNYDNSNINALLQNLQSALNQANTAAQNLQNALNSSNLANTTQSQTATTLNHTNTSTTQSQSSAAPTTTATPTTTAPVTMKLSDVKTDSTTSSPLKKLDFGNLSSIFSADKAAVHNTATGRAALPTHNARSATGPRSTQTPTTGRATTNGATSTPPQTNTAPAPTRANTNTKRIASER